MRSNRAGSRRIAIALPAWLFPSHAEQKLSRLNDAMAAVIY